MSKMKAAIIGAGNIAKTVHAPALLLEKESVEIVAVCDINMAAAQSLAQLCGNAPYFTDYKEMLVKQKPDIVCVCVPNVLHMEVVLESLKMGAHVICEKPPAVSYAQAVEMAEEAEKRKKVLAYNFVYRFRGETQAVQSLIQNNVLGNIYAGKITALRRRAVPGWGVFTSKEMQGGGALIDLGIHMLDTALYLLGYPKLAYVAAGSYDLIGKQGGEGIFGKWSGGEAFSVEDSLFGFIGFENGIVLSLETSFALHNAQREVTHMNIDLFGDKAGVSLIPVMLHTSDGAQLIDKSIPFESVNNTSAAVQDFIYAVSNNKKARANAEDTLLTQFLIENLYKAAEARKPIFF